MKKTIQKLIPELKRIIWPAPKKFAMNTGVTLSTILAFAAIMFGFDKIGEALVRAVLNLV